jgi:DNA-directed RNA polymerase subunit RPC12/RpoP
LKDFWVNWPFEPVAIFVTDKYVMMFYFHDCRRSHVFMPQRVQCNECGQALYEGADLRPPDEILHEHEGKCPKCGKKLSFVPIEVNVKPLK